MKKIFLIFICFIFSSLTTASDLKTDFSIDGNISSVKEGDLVEATLKIWPLENADKSELHKLQNNVLFNSFQLIQLQSIEPSANNADVVEVKGTYLVRVAKKLETFQLNYRGQIIAVEPPLIKIISLEKKAEDFFILDQALSFSHYQIYALIVLIIILAVGTFVQRDKLKKVIKRLKKDPQALAVKYFNEKFQKASTREDFEEIYARKEEWLQLLKERPEAYKEFFNIINQHQYKPSWGSAELKDVSNVFDIIRGSFK